MALSVCPSSPQTAALIVPLPCHALLMSLSLTQLLVHRLDVINLLKVEPADQPLPVYAAATAFASAVCSDSAFFISDAHFLPDFHVSNNPLAVTLTSSLSPSLSVPIPDIALLVYLAPVTLPKHEFFMCPSHVSLKQQDRQTRPKQAQNP